MNSPQRPLNKSWALANAQDFYQTAKRQAIAERTRLLQQLVTELRQNVPQYATPITTNMGKLWTEAQAEVKKGRRLCCILCPKRCSLITGRSLPRRT